MVRQATTARSAPRRTTPSPFSRGMTVGSGWVATTFSMAAMGTIPSTAGMETTVCTATAHLDSPGTTQSTPATATTACLAATGTMGYGAAAALIACTEM